MEYRLKYKGKEIDDRLDLAGTAIQEHQDISGLATKDELEEALSQKQDVIEDLAQIRSGASLGATAIQTHQDVSHLATKDELATELNKKVDKISGKGLSTNDYTSEEKAKVASLKNYDDTALKSSISSLQTEVSKKQDKLVSGSNIKTINGQSILGNGNITIEVGEDVDLSGYVTKVDADKIYQPKGNYALEDDIPINVSELNNDAKYITIEQVPTVDLTGYAKKEDIPTIPTKVSSFDNDKGYITIDDVTPYDDTEIKKQIASKVDANYVNSAINSAITNTLNTEV